MSASPTPKDQPVPRKRFAKSRFVIRWLWRSTKAVALLLLLAVVLGSSWIAWTNHRGQQAAVDIRQVVLDRGLRLDDESDPVDKLDNGARYILAASQALVFDSSLEEVAPIFGDAEWLEFGRGVDAEAADILQRMIAPNLTALELAKKARGYSKFYYDFNTGVYDRPTLPILGQLRSLARWYSIAAEAAAARGELGEAADMVAGIFHLSHSMREDHSLLFHLVERSIASLANGSVEDLLSRYEIDFDSLTKIQKAIEFNLRENGLVNALNGEVQTLAAIIDDADQVSGLVRFGTFELQRMQQEFQRIMSSDGSVDPISGWDRLVWRSEDTLYTFCPGITQQRGAIKIDYLLAAIDMIRANIEIDNAFTDDAEESGYLEVGSIASAQRTSRQVQSLLLCQLYAIEAEKYRLQNGHWPSEIDLLFPERLRPLDAWGNPLRLLETEFGLRIYSTGSDGEDDRGLARWDDYDPEEYNGSDGKYEPDDWRVRLLNPELRGRIDHEAKGQFP